MADTTIKLNSGSGGKDIATDADTSSPQKHYQYVKPVFGASGTYTNVTTSVGFPVNIVENNLNSSTVATNDSPQVYVTSLGLYDTTASPIQYVRAPGSTANGMLVNLGSNNDVTTELASAAALSDAYSNPTTAPVGSCLMGWDTSQSPNAWRRIITNSDGHVITDKDTESVALSDNISNTQPVPSDHAGNPHPEVTLPYYYDGSTWDRVRGDSTNGALVNLGANNDVALNAGTNLVGDVGISGARTSGGTTAYKNIDVDESEDQIKGTAGQVYWLIAMNMTASPLYLHLYNATAATVTVGSTAPTLTIPVPTLATTNGAGFVLSIPNGIAFGTAITVACTTTVDPTAASPVAGPAANGCVIALGYA